MKAQAAAAKGERYEPGQSRNDWREPTEQEAEAQFNVLPRANPMQPGMDQNITRIPEHLRDMINWAEDFKKGKKTN